MKNGVTKMERLTIIILNYNTKELTLRAIQSCLALPYQDLRVIIVDNASTDGSGKEISDLEKREQRISFVQLPNNLGFAGGNNVALKEVTSEYVMLLNSDAYFPESADIESALDFMDQYSDVGMLSPYVQLSSGRLDPASHRGFPNPWNAVCYFAGLEKIGLLKRLFGGYHQTWKDTQKIHDIDACTGAGMIIRRTAMEEVGLLDERFFMYGEDLDWCFRFKEYEWRIVFYPQLKVIHDKHSSGIKKMKGEREKVKGEEEEIRQRTKDAFYDAMKLFYQKHDLGPAWMENLVLFGIHLLSKRK